MSHNKTFSFQQFQVQDHNTSMKIGTDGVLIGAWATVKPHINILDIGAGCGLVSLMLAQRSPDSHIDAIEIDPEACIDCVDNFTQSPFKDRLRMINADFLAYEFVDKYDCVVSNPPFFSADTLSPNAARATARNNRSLPIHLFARKISQILSSEGTVSLIYQYDCCDKLIEAFAQSGLFPLHRCDVRNTALSKPKRVMLIFSRDKTQEISHREMILREKDNSYSSQYRDLTKDFHLPNKSLFKNIVV